LQAHAESFSDEFDRPDTEFSKDGSVIGESWVVAGESGLCKIKSGALTVQRIKNPAVLYSEKAETSSGGGKGFRIQADVTSTGWAGLIFNYQDPDNYYYLRYKPGSTLYHINARENGTDVMLLGANASEGFDPATAYTLTIESDRPGRFVVTVTKAGETKSLSRKQADDPKSRFKDGFGGIYCASSEASFDGFKFEPTSR
jgi:hypothetical protein